MGQFSVEIFTQPGSDLGGNQHMMMASASFDITLAFAGLFALAILGVLLYGAFAVLEQRVCGWASRKNDIATV